MILFDIHIKHQHSSLLRMTFWDFQFDYNCGVDTIFPVPVPQSSISIYTQSDQESSILNRLNDKRGRGGVDASLVDASLVDASLVDVSLVGASLVDVSLVGEPRHLLAQSPQPCCVFCTRCLDEANFYKGL